MGEAERKATDTADAEQGVVLPAEEEEAFEQMLVETDEDERAGRIQTLEEVLAKLRAATIPWEELAAARGIVRLGGDAVEDCDRLHDE